MDRAAGAESLVGSEALDLPGLHTTLAGARTLGRPQLPNQTFAVPQDPPKPQAAASSERKGGGALSHNIMERAHLSFRGTGSRTM